MPAPFDTVITVVNAANTRLNGEVDSLLPLGGQILDNTQAFSQQLVNSAYRKLQEKLVTLGLVLLQNEIIFSAVGALPVSDPAVQVYIGWNGYFDGVTLSGTPALPQDFIEPLEVQERVSDDVNPTSFLDMDNIVGTIPAIPKLDWNGLWQWRQNAVYMPGANTLADIRIRYAAYFPDFADTGDTTSATAFTPWFSQPIPIMRSFDAMVSYVCAEAEKARGNKDAAMAYTADGDASAGLLLGKDYMTDKQPGKAAEYSKMRDRFTQSAGMG